MRFWEKDFWFNKCDASPMLDGKNYVYWKVRVKVFIKSIDESVWQTIFTRWSPPVTTNDETKVVTLKPEERWTTEEECLAKNNFKALNVIFATVDVIQFKLISTCEFAKVS